MTPGQPPHPLPALTTYELIRYRRDLEHALALAAATSAPARAWLLARLAEVDAEQESRVRLRQAGGR